MDAYPEDYVAHNLPLVLLSGLGPDTGLSAEDDPLGKPSSNDEGIKIFSDFPVLTDSTAEELSKVLLDEDGSGAPWNSRHNAGRTGGVGFRVKKVGRVGQHSIHRIYASFQSAGEVGYIGGEEDKPRFTTLPPWVITGSWQ
jgi:hypothetical protein